MSERLRPRLIVVAGPNGSGKTSLTVKVLQHQWFEGCVYINPDNIARDELGDWNSPQAVLQAAQRAEARRMECLAHGQSLAFETVFSAPDKLDFLRQAQEKAYFIRLFFVSTDRPTINAERVAQRVIEGGHDVPIQKIIERYAKSISNCAAAATWVDRAYVYDNSIDDADPHLLFRTRKGALFRRYGVINDWARVIAANVDSGEDQASP